MLLSTKDMVRKLRKIQFNLNQVVCTSIADKTQQKNFVTARRMVNRIIKDLLRPKVKEIEHRKMMEHRQKKFKNYNAKNRK